MSLRPGLAALALLGCHQAASRPGPDPCGADVDASAAPIPADSLAGAYRVVLTADSGAADAVRGSLHLRAADPSLPPRTGPYGLADTTHRYPLVGTAELDLAAVGAVAPGGTTSDDPAAPGVLVIERVGGHPAGERILLRLGSEANAREPIRFDGGYTVLRVRQIARGGFRGDWESGAPMPRAAGRFCATRARDSS